MKRMVTRTVKANTYTVMTLDVETAEVLNIDYTIAGIFNETEALKALRKTYETPTLKLVAIVAHSIREILYGMDEEIFIANAIELPPRKIADE